MRDTKILLFSAMVSWMASACASLADSTPVAEPATPPPHKQQGDYKSPETAVMKQRALYKQIFTMTDHKTCETSSQCKFVAIGSNFCGGLDSYRVYSSVGTDEEKLRQLALEYAAMKRNDDQKFRRMGPCVMLPEPLPVCRENRCMSSEGEALE